MRPPHPQAADRAHPLVSDALEVRTMGQAWTEALYQGMKQAHFFHWNQAGRRERASEPTVVWLGLAEDCRELH